MTVTATAVSSDQQLVGVPIPLISCHPDNKLSLGLAEDLNNKIRVRQRRAYGYRDEEHLKLEIIASFLPALPKNVRIHSH